jgi:hypothetical protein
MFLYTFISTLIDTILYHISSATAKTAMHYYKYLVNIICMIRRVQCSAIVYVPILADEVMRQSPAAIGGERNIFPRRRK